MPTTVLPDQLPHVYIQVHGEDEGSCYRWPLASFRQLTLEEEYYVVVGDVDFDPSEIGDLEDILDTESDVLLRVCASELTVEEIPEGYHPVHFSSVLRAELVVDLPKELQLGGSIDGVGDDATGDGGDAPASDDDCGDGLPDPPSGAEG